MRCNFCMRAGGFIYARSIFETTLNRDLSGTCLACRRMLEAGLGCANFLKFFETLRSEVLVSLAKKIKLKFNRGDLVVCIRFFRGGACASYDNQGERMIAKSSSSLATVFSEL